MKTVTIESHFLKDIGIVLGRSMRHLSGSRNTFAAAAIMHIATILLLICVSCYAIPMVPDSYPDYLLPCILLVIIAGKELCLALVWCIAAIAAGLFFLTGIYKRRGKHENYLRASDCACAASRAVVRHIIAVHLK